ncbi:MAG: energy transducer TonB [Sphingobacteriaceae bacterium]|nr:MAG: energy transducer TonB [Sphingobacteriaceae bacterium]
MKTLFAAMLLLPMFFRNVSAQSYNKKLVAQLDTILKSDQLYRSRKTVIGSKEDNDNMNKQAILDRNNLVKIEKLFVIYGYPGKSLVGEKQQSTAFLVIQHSDQETQEKYLPMLTKAAEKGELKASSLGILVDRIKTGRGEKQIYGSQTHETKQGIKIYPIEDEQNVNIRRAKIGLQPLEIYLKHWNIDYKVPTPSKPNPPEMYYVAEQREESRVEAIGGDDAILSKVNYPAKAKENNITGFVTVGWTVDKNGNTKDMAIVKSLGYGCDEEALRVMKEAKFTNKTGEDHEMRMQLAFPYKKG